MQKKMSVFSILAFCFLISLGSGVTAAALPQTIAIDGFWYYDGYLPGNIPDAGYTVIPGQPITLYQERDTASPVAGVIPPGQEADILAVSYIARPGQYKMTVKQPLATVDGTQQLKPGDVVGFVSVYGGDAVAVYHSGEIIAVEATNIVFSPEPFRYPQAQNQWLYLSDRQGTSGWCQYSDGQNAVRKRWRVNHATAAGGAANLNPIVFGQYPKIQRLTMLYSQRGEN